MSVKYLNYVNLTSSSKEQPNERTPSPPPRKKSLSPPHAPSKSISRKSTHYTSSSSPKDRSSYINVSESAQDTNVGLGGSRFRNFIKKESIKKAFQDMMHELGEVNPTHAYYNGSRISQDTIDPSWSTSIKTERHKRHLQHWKRLGCHYIMLYLYLIGTLLESLWVTEPQELLPPQISPNDPYAQTMDNWPPDPYNPSPPLRVSRPPPGFPNLPPEFEPLPSTQPLFVNINNNINKTHILHNNAPPLENIHHPPPNLRNQDFPNPPNILDFVHPNDMPHLHNMFCQCCSTTRHEIQMLQNRVNYMFSYIRHHLGSSSHPPYFLH
ncbi:hypothetical protein Tco_0477740 [Tanacetum coccineum]